MLDEILGLLTSYVMNKLGFRFYEVLLERWERSADGPIRVLGPLKDFDDLMLPKLPIGDGSTAQTVYCFVQHRPLWITAEGGGPLNNPDAIFLDSWSGLRGLPPYTSGNDFDIKTSIIQPLRNGSGAFGVINVESEDHLVPNRWAKDELEAISRAVAAIAIRYVAHKTIRNQTKASFDRLGAQVEDWRWNVMRKPKLFLASSERASPDVIEVVDEAVSRLDGYEVADWRHRTGSGGLREQMLRDLRESSAIVFYLSEPTGETSAGEKRYADNANVLFEAGIAEGLRCAWSDVTLIPIREQCSPETPFDISDLNIVVVHRDDDGELNRDRLRRDLEQRLRERP